MNRIIVLLLLVFTCSNLKAAKKIQPYVKRIDPSYWWVGMQNPNVQLCIYGNNISSYNVAILYPGITITNIKKVENANYLFVNLHIAATTKPGTFHILLFNGILKIRQPYLLKPPHNYKPTGLNTSDLVYLIMPDRFCNGDTTNDIDYSYTDKTINQNNEKSRHGGDIQGIISKLPYIKQLGNTAIWFNPMLENNQPAEAYHGYAITDHYKIDSRLGTNEQFKLLVDSMHRQQLKIVWDVVLNHIGNECWFFKDLPDSSWINWWPSFTRTTYKDGVLMDPYASKMDKKYMSNGWFDTHMPDLNQKNNEVATYLLQQQIWWVKAYNIDALRLDTYAYPDLEFEKNWITQLKNEFPSLFIFGETWVHGAANQNYFVKSNVANGYQSNLDGVTDFQLYYAFNKTLTESFGWTEGINTIYHTLCTDYLYQNPFNNIIFLDNHDLSRFWSICNYDLNKFKIGVGLLLTARGIPMLYTGTEILNKNFANASASNVRENFLGGFPADSISKFSVTGRTTIENEAWNYIATLANWRKNNIVFQKGKLMQFVPENGVYVYFRYIENNQVMVAVNTNATSQNIDTQRFNERLNNYSLLKDALNNVTQKLTPKLNLPANSISIFECK